MDDNPAVRGFLRKIDIRHRVCGVAMTRRQTRETQPARTGDRTSTHQDAAKDAAMTINAQDAPLSMRPHPMSLTA